MGNITKYLKGIFLISAVLLFVVGCSSIEKKEEKDFSVGIVLGEGGANDQSFNQSSLEGLEKAKKDLGIDGIYLESNQDSDYVPNIETFIDKDVDLIIGVGYTTAESMLTTIIKKKDKKYLKIW